ncbi:hypothetical protein DJ69_08955 [Halorubrum persicum]|uniref:Uncharacterized protein n=1 Tax=Halorubrum persicum TaxID=1383844 RepID=A0A2G1WIW5_9EURY|nr:hypothetical protein [Halorubrum persicum]PHQ38922.1 hypothetical protein DJ69_08955 [Halorubrum persicum]
MSAYPTEDPYEAFLLTDPAGHRAQFAIDYPDEYKRAVYDELLASGSVTVLNYQLAYEYEFGSEQRDRPQFATDGDRYYRIHVETARTVERDWWEFYLDLQDSEQPDSTDPVTIPVTSLSDRDQQILQQAMEAAAADRDPAIDVGDQEPGSRGVTYHHHLDIQASDLVPSPPFDYLQHNNHLFQARAEQNAIPVSERTFTAEQISESQSEYEQHICDTVLEIDFSTVSLSSEATEVLDTATDGRPVSGFYEESPPMSDGLDTILTRLNAADHVREHSDYGEYTTFPNMYAIYDGSWYEFELTVYP